MFYFWHESVLTANLMQTQWSVYNLWCNLTVLCLTKLHTFSRDVLIICELYFSDTSWALCFTETALPWKMPHTFSGCCWCEDTFSTCPWSLCDAQGFSGAGKRNINGKKNYQDSCCAVIFLLFQFATHCCTVYRFSDLGWWRKARWELMPHLLHNR